MSDMAFKNEVADDIRDVIKDDFGGKLPSGHPFRPDIRACLRLPHGWFLTVRGRGKNRVRADAGVRPRGCEKKKNKFFFGSCCQLGKREIIFNFRFSIPDLPDLPELRALRGRSREKKKVFSA
jgi:hypothetical protein